MKIGILGGSFDPVHEAHLFVARRILTAFSLDQIWFMVANVPPHREKRPVTSGFHRYAMTVLALQGDNDLLASSWEMERGGASFTVDTLDSLRHDRPADRFCFIAGSDSLSEIHSWKDYGTLLLEHCFVFVQRPGFEVDLEALPLPARLKEVIEPVCSDTRRTIQSGRSYLINLNPPPVSSTLIREAIASGRLPAEDSLSPAVLAYIGKHRLYEDKPEGPEESLRDY